MEPDGSVVGDSMTYKAVSMYYARISFKAWYVILEVIS